MSFVVIIFQQFDPLYLP